MRYRLPPAPAITGRDLPIDPRLRSTAVELLKRGVPQARICAYFAASPEQLQALVGQQIKPPRVPLARRQVAA